MKGRSFVLGILVGVAASAVLLALAIALVASRPVQTPQQAGSPPIGDITVSIQEGYLGRLATKLAREQQPTIQIVVVDVQPGARVNMTAGLQVTILGQALDLQARLINTVVVGDARLRFDLQKLEFAGIDIPLDLLPRSLSATLEATVEDVNDQANRMLIENGLVPLGVTTNDSSIAVSLRVQ